MAVYLSLLLSTHLFNFHFGKPDCVRDKNDSIRLIPVYLASVQKRFGKLFKVAPV